MKKSFLTILCGFLIGLCIGAFRTLGIQKKEAAEYIQKMDILISAIQAGAEPSENGVYEIALSKGEVMLVYPSSDKTRPYVFSTYTKEGKPLKMIEKSSFGLKEALFQN